MGPVRYLLDTCVFVWLTCEPGRLSPLARQAIDDPRHQIVLSDVSIWEICLKWEARKIKLPSPPRAWCEVQILLWKLKSLEITRNHMFRSTELPSHHRDPFDRLLAAQALEEGLKLLTPDNSLHQYPVAVIW